MLSVTKTFCCWNDWLPRLSVKYQRIEYDPGTVYVNGSNVVALIIPMQLSVDVGICVTVTEHWPDNVGKEGEFGTGSVVSVIVTVCCCVDVWPLPSLYVQLITEVPWELYVVGLFVVPTIVP